MMVFSVERVVESGHL